MIRRPPRSTLDRSSAASDVYKRQVHDRDVRAATHADLRGSDRPVVDRAAPMASAQGPVSYTHLRAHETVLDLVCRLLLEKKQDTHPELRYTL